MTIDRINFASYPNRWQVNTEEINSFYLISLAYDIMRSAGCSIRDIYAKINELTEKDELHLLVQFSKYFNESVSFKNVKPTKNEKRKNNQRTGARNYPPTEQ